MSAFMRFEDFFKQQPQEVQDRVNARVTEFMARRAVESEPTLRKAEEKRSRRQAKRLLDRTKRPWTEFDDSGIRLALQGDQTPQQRDRSVWYAAEVLHRTEEQICKRAAELGLPV